MKTTGGTTARSRLTALAGVTLVDIFCASGLTGEKGGRKTAVADYSRRTGFPQGIHSARAAARNFELPVRVQNSGAPAAGARATTREFARQRTASINGAHLSSNNDRFRVPRGRIR
jgi:hypothetical protein